MAWSTGQLFSFVEFLINKSQSLNLTPDNFFYAWNSEQRMYMSDLLGRFQARNTGKTGANTGLLENETILTKLAPFTTPVTLTVTAGNATKPSDFIYGLALRINDKEVYMIKKGQIQSVVNSVIDPPSITDNKYYGTEYLGYYQLFPSAVTSVALDYIADVRDVVYATIPDGNGRPVYDPGSSIQPQWDSLSLIEVTKRTLKSLGVHYTSQDFEQFGNSVINTGN
jgi:hypothetical protein